MIMAAVASERWSSGQPRTFEATAQVTDVMMERAPLLKYLELPTSSSSGRSIFTRSLAAEASLA